MTIIKLESDQTAIVFTCAKDKNAPVDFLVYLHDQGDDEYATPCNSLAVAVNLALSDKTMFKLICDFYDQKMTEVLGPQTAGH